MSLISHELFSKEPPGQGSIIVLQRQNGQKTYAFSDSVNPLEQDVTVVDVYRPETPEEQTIARHDDHRGKKGDIGRAVDIE